MRYGRKLWWFMLHQLGHTTAWQYVSKHLHQFVFPVPWHILALKPQSPSAPYQVLSRNFQTLSLEKEFEVKWNPILFYCGYFLTAQNILRWSLKHSLDSKTRMIFFILRQDWVHSHCWSITFHSARSRTYSSNCLISSSCLICMQVLQEAAFEMDHLLLG